MERKEQLQQMVEAYRELRVPEQERTILYEVIQKAKKRCSQKTQAQKDLLSERWLCGSSGCACNAAQGFLYQ